MYNFSIYLYVTYRQMQFEHLVSRHVTIDRRAVSAVLAAAGGAAALAVGEQRALARARLAAPARRALARARPRVAPVSTHHI